MTLLLHGASALDGVTAAVKVLEVHVLNMTDIYTLCLMSHRRVFSKDDFFWRANLPRTLFA